MKIEPKIAKAFTIKLSRKELEHLKLVLGSRSDVYVEVQGLDPTLEREMYATMIEALNP